MKLQAIFEKQVDRHIEGVIKADDEESLKVEVEEYVLTTQVAKRLDLFLDAYLNYEGANGVWLSGFFGSGKSHLLKMLALLLENRSVEGTAVLDLFLSKPEIQDDEILKRNLDRAVAIPSRSILFNIDQKADVISKTEVDALLAVFVKVFDEACGYYGKQGYVAQLERELGEAGKLEDFKREFQVSSGEDWEFGRQRLQRFSEATDGAYGKATGQKTNGILAKYKADYKVSIEDFAEQINDYINRQGKDFRLNFFVDEVGQYVAENTKLMTNLQTIAESLATKCRGRAWIIVTAQQDMDAVVGEMGQQQGNDFSKIMARFNTKMSLTSANVDEVIQKRLLLKNEKGVSLLSGLYHKQENNLKTLFDFADGAKHYKNFKNREHFIRCYPFIPYQFTLFQVAIQSLSNHSAFEGKHSSVGERSMLGVFQQVAVHISDCGVGDLATFDLMFEGLRSAIKSQIQQAVIIAEKNLDNQFAIKLLKALFLVKYVKDYKATTRNLCVLMLDSFDRDLTDLRKEVEGALNLLEQQTYIQRNGDEYEFLTDDEKDVEQEIKNTEVELNDVAEELSKVIFDQVLKTRKIRYDDNGQDYAFSRKLDDRLHGRESELGIHVISPFHDLAGKEEIIRMQSMGRDELFVVMNPDERLIRDLMMYKKTDKYVGQSIAVAQQENVKLILMEKRHQNRARFTDLQQRVKTQLGKARLFVNGEEVEQGGEEPIGRITKGFYRLIQAVYPNLRMLRGVNYSESDINGFLQQGNAGLFADDKATLSEAELEMLAFIQTNSLGGVRTSLKSLIERFEKKPYGWYQAAILCNTAKLSARGKLEVRNDSNVLEDAALERALKNSHGYPQVLITPQVAFSAGQVRQLKDFFAEFFDSPATSGEAKVLAKETGEAFQKLQTELGHLAAQVKEYPFLSALDEPRQRIQEIAGKPYTFYLTDLSKVEDSLLDLKEQILDPIRQFMSGSKKDLFNEAHKFLQVQGPNFPYVEGSSDKDIRELVESPNCYKGNSIQQVRTLVDSLGQDVFLKVQEERDKAAGTVQGLRGQFEAMPEFLRLDEEQQQELSQSFDDFSDVADGQSLIAVLRENASRFKSETYPQLLGRMTTMLTPPTSGDDYEDTDGQNGGQGSTQEPPPRFVSSGTLQIDFSKGLLVDSQDVDDYLEALRQALIREIKAGKRITI